VKRNLFAIALSLPLLSTAAHAQTTQLKASVPFEFIAGDTVLPAGDYDVQSIDPWGEKRFQFTVLIRTQEPSFYRTRAIQRRHPIAIV
jgi:hypothetical protein